MTIKGVDLDLFPVVFPMSLEPVCQKLVYSLKHKDFDTWEGDTQEFMSKYKPNIEIQTTLRELEVFRQGNQEGFTTYLNK